jgi:hypothetical protein
LYISSVVKNKNKMKVLLLLENDTKFPDCILRFRESYLKEYPNAEVLDFNYLRTKTDDELNDALRKATDIAFQTQFCQGSEYQVVEIFRTISKMRSKSVYIQNYDVKKQLSDHLGDELLFRSRKHSIYKIYDSFSSEKEPLDFSESIANHLAKIQKKRIEMSELRKLKMEAKTNPTGIKVRILACNANSREFNALPIGSVVDVLDCSQFDPNPSRGVWVWGLTEPVKLINDCGLQEYEIINQKIDPEKVLDLAFKQSGVSPSNFSEIELKGLLHIFNDDELDSLNKSQEFCDFVGIERRGNRRIISNLFQ